MADTYVVTTSAGQVRLLTSDTNVSGTHVWSDAEITAFLTLGGNNVFKAAGIALRSAAADYKKVAGLVGLFGEVNVDMRSAVRSILELAESYETIAMGDAEAQLTQLQEKIDLYGRDNTDHTLTTAETDLSDYDQEQWDALT